MEEIFAKIVRDENVSERIVDSIFESLDTSKLVICSRSFTLQTLKFLTSKFDDNKVKVVVEEELTKHVSGYSSLASSSKSRYKKATILLFILYLQKSNCQ